MNSLKLQNHGVNITLEHGANLGVHVSGNLVPLNNGHYFQLEYDQVKEIVEFLKDNIHDQRTNQTKRKTSNPL